MKLSRYNVLKTIDNTHIVFNTKTCALATLNEQEIQLINDIKSGCFVENNYNSDLVSKMIRFGCILPDNIDELDQIEYMNNVAKYSSKVLGLTIAPTMECNFRCVYCFEEHSKCNMDINVQDAIVKYVKQNISGLERLAVAWFGGEPMLEKSTVYSLSQRLISLCEAHSVLYNATMISNGSLFTDEDVAEIKRSKISTVQITLDGPRDVHDRRRIDISGISSFDKIIKNIKLLSKNKIKVRVRINVDFQNSDSVDILLKELRNFIPNFKDVMISFGHVKPYTDECKCVEDACINDSDYAETNLALNSKAVQYGFELNKMMLYPHVRMTHCGACMKNSIIVDPEGYLYKCSSCIGKKALSYGNILHGYDMASPNYLNWIKWSPFDYPKCKECVWLPLCMGGCQAMAKKESNNTKVEPICELIKYNIDGVLSYYYNMLR